MKELTDLNRREFIRAAGMAGIAAMLLPHAGIAAGSRMATGKRVASKQ